MTDQPTVSAPLVHLRILAAEQFGVDPALIYRHTAIDESVFQKADSRLTLEQENAVWRAIVKATGDEHIGLRIGPTFQLSALGLLGYVLMNTRTLGESWQKFCNYERVIANTYHHSFGIEGQRTLYSMHVLGPWHNERKHTLDLSMTAAIKIAEDLTGRDISPLKVNFQFQQPEDTSPYQRAFSSSELQFSCSHSSIAFDKDLADFPVIGSNQDMFATFDEQVKALLERTTRLETHASRVKRLIMVMMNGEAPSIEATAKQLAMSVRNLQLKLRKEGTSFQKLLDECRRDMAIKFLENNVASKSEIAYLLGFSEVGAFSRGFRRWTGLTPSEFQQSAQGG